MTDANLLLGYLNPQALAGGSLPLEIERARKVLWARVAEPLGLTLEQAAHGARAVANGNMVRAVRAVSTERGRDPRDFTLFAFGGNGPVHGVDVAALIGIKRVVVPPAAGVLSALGLLLGRLEQHFGRSFYRRLASISPPELAAAWSELEAEARRSMEADGFAEEEVQLLRLVDVRYVGQSHELTLPFPSGLAGPAALAAVARSFGEAHRREYGHAAPDDPVEIVNLRVVASVAGHHSLLSYAGQEERSSGFSGLLVVPEPSQAAGSAQGARMAYFGRRLGWVEAPLLTDRLAFATARPGPCILEEYDATTVVPPGATAHLDAGGNLVIDLGASLLAGGIGE